MIRKFKLYVGVGFDSQGDKIASEVYRVAASKAEAYLVEKFGGFTLVYGIGRGKDDKRSEQVNIYTVFTDKGPDLREVAQRAAQFVGYHFKQKSVLVEVENKGSLVFPTYGNVIYPDWSGNNERKT